MSSPYDKLALGYNATPRLTVFDGETGVGTSPAFGAPPGQVNGVAISPDGTIVAVAHSNLPRLSLYDAETLEPITGPSVTPTNNGAAVCWSADGSLLAVAHGTSPFVTIYNTADWSKVPNPSVLPGSAGVSCAFSADGSKLVVGHLTSPFITIYNTADWSKVPNPSELPAGSAYGVSWSPDGTLLAVAHSNSPRITVYLTASWTKLVNPAVLPVTNGRRVAFSPDGSKLYFLEASGGSSVQGYVVYNTSNWSVITGLPDLPAASGTDGCFIDNSHIAAVWGSSPYAWVIDITEKAVIETFESIGSTTYAVAAYTSSTEPPPDPGVDIDTDIEITVTSAAQTIDTDLRVQVVAPSTIDTSLAATVLDPSVMAGLNGAGGWSASPDGKWRAVVTLAGADISARIMGAVRVSQADDEAATAEFSLLPASVLEPLDLIRQPVRITFAQGSGLNAQLMFSGVIDVPEFEHDTGLIRCRCVDQLQEIIANTPVEWIDENVGGRFSEVVSGTPVDNWAYLEERIKSVPKSIALDKLQRPVVLPWADLPRSVTVKQADYIDGTLSVELPSSAQLRTRVTARLEFRYTLLRARGATVNYAQPFAFYASYTPSTGLVLRQWLLTSMIESATERLPAWERRGLPIISHPEAKTYYNSNPAEFLGYTITSFLAPQLATGFSARYETRWSQTITESYATTLVWTDLEAQLGAQIPEEFGANYLAPAAPERWTSDYSTLPALAPPPAGDATLPWLPGDEEDLRDEALRTLHDQAYVILRKASRTGRVRFSLPCRPDFWLDLWATVETSRLRAAGKIVALDHVLETATGEATTGVVVAVGLPGNTPAAIPVATIPELPDATPVPPLTAFSVDVGTFSGGEIGSPPFDPETMIGFSTNVQRTGAAGEESYNYYPHQLSIRAPDIEADARDPLVIPAALVVPVAVPTDLLEILS